MPRRLPGLARSLSGGSLAAVAYGEVGSSIYFALGIVALFALGLTPWVLLAVGALFMLVALSYAEGTAAIPETGGAAMLARRAFNDPVGFLTGWVLLLDYSIVIALAALFAPHYLGHAVGWERVTRHPWDVVAAVFIILGITVLRLIRRPGLYKIAVVVAAVAFVSQLLLVGLGFAFLFSFSDLRHGTHIGVAPSWHAIAFVLPAAMLAYTGLETVANLAQEANEPGKTMPRSLFAGLGAAVLVSAVVGIVGIAAFPAIDGPRTVATQLGSDWLRAPLVGIVAALERPHARGARRHPARHDRAERRGDPARGRDDVDLRRRTGRLLARAPPDAPAHVRHLRPPQHAAAGGDPRGRRRLEHARRPRRLDRERGALPREPVQLRRADHVRDRPGRGRSPPLHRARPRAAVQGAAQPAHPRAPGAGRRARRDPARRRALGRVDRHAPGGAHRRPRVARAGRRALRRRTGPARIGAARACKRRCPTSSRQSRAPTSGSSSRSRSA